ncbi:hypothetical protein [Actinophytocola sp.]|uniref:hypothetical protein n=1 Tax=Actinophytocola sp. TaxID=1872138 RepID=UPI002D42E3EA|nr:hypothetical protein [Actinophytocola sp.]HYQ66548.1 hypothetical protein [Actinophytocola sp.]
MDPSGTWDWRAWSLAVLAAAVAGWFLFRWLSALAFRHMFVGRLARRHGWRVDVPATGGRAAFDEQERRRRRKAWALLRKGRISEGYRTGVFGKTHTGAWHPELTVTGTWRGHRFTATQSRRYELTSGETTRRRVRRRASVTLAGTSTELGPRLRRGRLIAALDRLADAADRQALVSGRTGRRS